jgi:hypothetical protein
VAKANSMGTLGNVPLFSAHGRCTMAALSCILRKAHHEFRSRIAAHDLKYNRFVDSEICYHSKKFQQQVLCVNFKRLRFG